MFRLLDHYTFPFKASSHPHHVSRLFAQINMTSPPPSTSTPATCEERTEELVRKIKEISSSSSKPSTNNGSQASTSKDGSSLKQTPIRPKSPASDTRPTFPIEIIYSAKTHRRSPSPPPKSLARTFPCPPEISFPNETKIISQGLSPRTKNISLPQNSIHAVPAIPIIEKNEDLEPGLTASKETQAKVYELSKLRTRGRAKRGKGNLWTPPKTTPTRILARPSTSSIQTEKAENLPKPDNSGASKAAITLANRFKPTRKIAIPEWLRNVPEGDNNSNIASALDHGVCDADDPRLEDAFTLVEMEKFQARMKQIYLNEHDWESIRAIWNGNRI